MQNRTLRGRKIKQRKEDKTIEREVDWRRRRREEKGWKGTEWRRAQKIEEMDMNTLKEVCEKR